MKRLCLLFWEMFRIALCVVGGGFAIIAVADEVFARKRKWIAEGELVDQIPLFQMMPGIMAGHAAVYVGRKVAGWTGSLVALVAVALPSILIFSAVSMGYEAIPLDNRWLLAVFAGLRAALTGVIFAMVVRTWKKSLPDGRSYVGFAAALGALLVPGVSVLWIILAAILLGVLSAAGQDVWGRASSSREFPSCGWLAPLVFLKYGAVAFGGGYVLVPMYLQDFVGPDAPFLRIPSEEFANLMALTQMTPGPIGINAATFFGYRMFGFGGSLLTTLCLLVPGFIVLSLALMSLERFRENRYVKRVMRCVKPVTVAMMVSALWSFAGMSLWTASEAGVVFHPFAWVLAVLVAVAMLLRKLGVVTLIFLSAFASVGLEYLIYLHW